MIARHKDPAGVVRKEKKGKYRGLVQSLAIFLLLCLPVCVVGCR